MRVWAVGAGSVLAVVAVVAAASARALRAALRRRAVPSVPLRHPVAAADQDEIRALIAGRRNVEAVELLRRRYRLPDGDARAVAGDVVAHQDYPPDWRALATRFDGGVRDEVRRLVAQGRRPAALRLLRSRFGLSPPDADSLVSAFEEDAPGEQA